MRSRAAAEGNHAQGLMVWAAAGTLVAFATMVIAGYENLSRVSVPFFDVARPRVHMEPLPPRVHPEAREHAAASPYPDLPRRPTVIGPMPLPGGAMGTSLGGRIPVSDRVVVASIPPAPAAGSATKPRPSPKPKAARAGDVAPKVKISTKNVASKGKATPTRDMKSRTIVGSLSNRKVTGNGGRLILEPRTMRMFAELERRWGEKLQVRWAYRDRKLNRRVGGKSKSFHLRKMAVDIVHGGWSAAKMRRFVRLAYSIGFRGFGMGRNVIHLDSRPNLTSWNYGGNRYGLAYRMVR